MKENNLRELSPDEMEKVSGGVCPMICKHSTII